jgi:hypothetical protein
MYVKNKVSKQLKGHLIPCQNFQGSYFSKQKDMNDVICAHFKIKKKKKTLVVITLYGLLYYYHTFKELSIFFEMHITLKKNPPKN